MKILTILSIFTVLMTGCATVHKKCMDPDVVSQYRDYNQCYQEISAARERARHAWEDMFKTEPNRSISCNTTGSTIGNFNSSTTTCE